MNGISSLTHYPHRSRRPLGWKRHLMPLIRQPTVKTWPAGPEFMQDYRSPPLSVANAVNAPVLAGCSSADGIRRPADGVGADRPGISSPSFLVALIVYAIGFFVLKPRRTYG